MTVGDLCYGAQAIADHLGVPLATVYSLQRRQIIPTWREGKALCARRSSLNAWMSEREASAQRTAGAADGRRP